MLWQKLGIGNVGKALIASAARAYTESKCEILWFSSVSASGTRCGNGADSINPTRLHHFMQVFATAKTCYRGVRQSPSPLRLREHTRNLNARF
ncbi:hypothetical protein [uncultured Helicobacter sp.]|uniref:hypothetical protein n=1 Tax=uncultured Helicobacter sp. TaxID=175537 RepID=UPI003753072F